MADCNRTADWLHPTLTSLALEKRGQTDLIVNALVWKIHYQQNILTTRVRGVSGRMDGAHVHRPWDPGDGVPASATPPRRFASEEKGEGASGDSFEEYNLCVKNTRGRLPLEEREKEKRKRVTRTSCAQLIYMIHYNKSY